MSGTAQYLAAALIDFAMKHGERGVIRGDASQLPSVMEDACRFKVSDAVTEEVLDLLSQVSIATITDDDLAGRFYRVDSNRLQTVVNRSESYADDLAINIEKDPRILSDEAAMLKYKEVQFLQRYPALLKYHEYGDEWLFKALSRLRETSSSADTNSDLAGQIEVPASDRIVHLNHNQKEALEDSTSNLIEEVAGSNVFGADADERHVVVGRLKAARELFREQVFQAKIVYLLLVDMLEKLISKYKDHAIGAAASKLLDLLIETIFG